MNSVLGLKNFKFVLRLSDVTENENLGTDTLRDLIDGEFTTPNKKSAIWDKDFIIRELKAHVGKISKVWVCGPPMMN